ncbi:predicted protein [Uncinocarpus reesii 1704]|uniref:Uncharacterized protein n=1 Tax=Uncinocarpus reesii (strain UAMH 1704) TaxID=336963 RepID=C4JXZ4_UNCRE|nr:uncharacterized protein UREG_07045 [Uncinocarpus reesii 1704]EEP82180.1 predicted protein [Uncinocarpus reesii 1704]
MDVSEFTDDMLELCQHRESRWVSDLEPMRFPESKCVWQFGPIFAEREILVDDDMLHKKMITEASATCVATQVQGPNPGLQRIAKIRVQIPDEDDPSSTEPAESSACLAFELSNLRDLTDLGCAYTPKLLDYVIARQGENHYVPGGFFGITIMERLPGQNLIQFDKLPLAERDQVRLAFAKAFRYRPPVPPLDTILCE